MLPESEDFGTHTTRERPGSRTQRSDRVSSTTTPSTGRRTAGDGAIRTGAPKISPA